MRFQIFIDRELDALGQFEYKAFLSETGKSINPSIAHGSGRTPWEALESLKCHVTETLRRCAESLKNAPDVMLTSISPKDLRLMANCIEFTQGQLIKEELDER